jgi:hypothetical protein
VASVLIEKPARGDFLPIVEGGFSLQYSPLLEYREGRGMVLFCQLDVTGRTEPEPAARQLVANMVKYVKAWTPSPTRTATYVGELEGRKHLQSVGIDPATFEGGELPTDSVLVAGPGSRPILQEHTATVLRHLKAGGFVLAVGLGEHDVPCRPQPGFAPAEHIATYFDPPRALSWLAGIGPADVHNRDPRQLLLVNANAERIGNGVLARANRNVVYCQLVPWHFSDPTRMNLKRTHRRTSFLLTRLLSNLGVAGSTPLLERFSRPVNLSGAEQRWLQGLYLDQPEEWDDPYRFFRW